MFENILICFITLLQVRNDGAGDRLVYLKYTYKYTCIYFYVLFFANSASRTNHPSVYLESLTWGRDQSGLSSNPNTSELLSYKYVQLLCIIFYQTWKYSSISWISITVWQVVLLQLLPAQTWPQGPGICWWVSLCQPKPNHSSSQFSLHYIAGKHWWSYFSLDSLRKTILGLRL